MLAASIVLIADRYWAGHLGVDSGQFFTEPFRLIAHGGELAEYHGIFALFRGDSVMVSVPPGMEQETQALLAGSQRNPTPASLAESLGPLAAKVIGPAYIGYASTAPAMMGQSARALTPADASALDALERASEATEWDHGGSAIEHPASGVFLEGQLVALAGYEVWGGEIAHISIITHPGFRGRHFGREAVAHLAGRAVAAGLLPQYRTLDANEPSIHVAESLGFQRYATSLAVRLKSPA